MAVMWYLILCSLAVRVTGVPLSSGPHDSTTKLDGGHGNTRIRHATEEKHTWYRCGEDRCVCNGIQAVCNYSTNSGIRQTRIPDLPSNITFLIFSTNVHIYDNDVCSLDETLIRLRQVTRLDLTHNNLSCKDLGAILMNLSLEVLTLRRYYHCKIFSDTGIHTTIPTLRELDLGDSDITSLPLSSLAVFTGLRRLRLNKIESRRTNAVITGYLALFQLKGLVYLDLSENRLSCDNMYEVLTLPLLKELVLKDGSVCNVLRVDLDRLKRSSVVTLVLSGNRFQILRLLTEANDSSCSSNFTSPFSLLTSVDLSNNQLYRLDLGICFPQLQTINLRNNELEQILRSVSDQSTSNFPSLKELDLSENHLKDSFRELIGSVHFKHVKHLNLKRNQVTFIDVNRAFDSSQLKSIVLDKNSIQFSLIDANSFLGCPDLTDLSLADNDFKGVSEERFQRLFGHLRHLRNLSMRSSGLLSITSGTFRGLVSLEYLDLSYNSLVRLPEDAFQELPYLNNVSLFQNKITVVHQEAFSWATRHRLQQINISTNPFECSCDIVWFQRWLLTNPSQFGGAASDYTCANLPDTTVTSFFKQRQACIFSPETSKFIIATISLIFIGMSLSSFLYRYRWHIRLVLFESFLGRGNRRVLPQNSSFHYDMFVSYDKEDFPWVRNHLMPMLEEGMGLKLCLHQRDLIPGAAIVDNIMESVQSSKKMMMIFSRNFARSHWCQFELQLCLSHAIHNQDMLLIVILEDIPSRDLTPAMMAVMKTTTYIEWADDPDARSSFRRRMGIAVHELLSL